MKKKKSAQSFGIIGLGRFGMALAISLTQAGKEVIVIDRNESKLREIRQYTDYAFVAPDLRRKLYRRREFRIAKWWLYASARR